VPVWHDDEVFAEDVRRQDEIDLAGLRRLMDAYARRSPVASVAVVANAPLSADPGRARTIDGCDLVIRCNSFVLDRGTETYVGREADVVVLNPGTRITRSLFDGYSRRLYLRSIPGAIYRRRASVPMPRVDLWPDDLGAIDIPNRAVLAPLRALVTEADPRPSTDPFVVPTTGMIACWLARQLYPGARLVVTGFSSLAGGQTTEWLHHGRTDQGPVPVSTVHKIDAEGIVLRRWISEGAAVHLN
jgi:hypothetical protein